MKQIHIIIHRNANLPLPKGPVLVYDDFDYYNIIAYAELKAIEWGVMAEITMRPSVEIKSMIGRYPVASVLIDSISFSYTRNIDPLIPRISAAHIVEVKPKPKPVYASEAKIKEVLEPTLKRFKGKPISESLLSDVQQACGDALIKFFKENPGYKDPSISLEAKAIFTGVTAECRHKPEGEGKNIDWHPLKYTQMVGRAYRMSDLGVYIHDLLTGRVI